MYGTLDLFDPLMFFKSRAYAEITSHDVAMTTPHGPVNDSQQPITISLHYLTTLVLFT